MNQLAVAFVFVLYLSYSKMASAQEVSDAPAALLPSTCISLSHSDIAKPSAFAVDLVFQVDATGTPASVSTMTDIGSHDVLEKLISIAMTCRFRPAMKDKRPTEGMARVLAQFNPESSAAALRRKANIIDLESCAPKASDYPPESKRREETGTTTVSFTVDPKGRVTAFGVVKLSKYLRLDFTALIKLATCKFQPATAEDGTPVSASFTVDYVWRLE